ncbi:tryptophan--tRNA ligase [Gemmatimonas aurantiaca]|nr:tryptophan--tRNA ligase [Gemmatimonas aurantiaca]
MSKKNKKSSDGDKATPSHSGYAPDKRQTILSGMQPTGALHIGNLEGALRNWVALQDEYEMFCCIVDWHSLTAEYADTSGLKDKVHDMTIDWLSSGLDPDKCSIFIQSDVPEHAELHLILSMLISVPTLTRLPTFVEKKDEQGMDSYGFLGYPVLQAADILVYGAHKVPVGKDQAKHIWLANDLAKRFNHYYGSTLVEPEALFTKIALIPGSDGKKMSKSIGNHIALTDSEEETAKKLKRYFTDPEKLRKNDPGRPEICPVFKLHQVYSGADNIEETIVPQCKSGELGCVDCKGRLTKNLNNALAPIREKRVAVEKNSDYIWDVLAEGAKGAKARAAEVMDAVRSSMQMKYHD